MNSERAFGCFSVATNFLRVHGTDDAKVNAIKLQTLFVWLRTLSMAGSCKLGTETGFMKGSEILV